MQVPLLFDVMLHAGTLLAVFAFFWKDILKVLSAVSKFDFKSESGKLALFLLIGTVPIALVGFLFYKTIAPLFDSLFAAGAGLIITGCALYSTKFFKNGNGRQLNSNRQLNSKNALLIGISQAVSLVPGISRSGVTISTALFKKIGREQAFAFSFLLAIPAIIMANVFELYRTTDSVLGWGVMGVIGFEMIIGAAVAAIVGYLSLKFLRDILRKGKFYLFAYYCWIVGAILLIYIYFGL